ncbi:MAG TPA: hypothetical protein VFF78_05560 [Anaerolineaceae bacterium]|nr:hypothetical protein [Anaerolineaceae bacterium]
MDKKQLVTEITRLEGELSRLERKLRAEERERYSTKGENALGAAGILFGTVFLFIIPPVGAFIIAISFLAAALAEIKAARGQRITKAKISATEEKITQTRSKLAELRVELISM